MHAHLLTHLPERLSVLRCSDGRAHDVPRGHIPVLVPHHALVQRQAGRDGLPDHLLALQPRLGHLERAGEGAEGW